jgi:hypothetical protein
VAAGDERVRAIVARKSPRTIAGAVEWMEAIQAALPARDGIARFNRLYLEVTRTVHTEVQRSSFRDEAFLSRLDVVFAGLYFAALRAALDKPAALPKAWAPLCEARRRKRIAAIQFALAGMNAHINRDLPVALVQTASELKVDLENAKREHADFERVNPVLAQVEARVKRWFLTGELGEIDRALGPVDDRIAMWNVCRARDAAWDQAQVLWCLRGQPALARSYLLTLDRTTGFAGRGLLVPLR